MVKAPLPALFPGLFPGLFRALFPALLLALLVPACRGLAGQQNPTPHPDAAPAGQQKPEEIPDAPGANIPGHVEPTGPYAIFDTSMGRISCKLFSQQAPKTVANFIGLATGSKDWTDPATHQPVHGRPLYNGTIFHRVFPGFMIQGGDPEGTGMGGPGYKFEDEFDPNLNFDLPGRLAMANAGPNTNGSQFFITETQTEHLNQHHTIFGQCDDSGILVVKSIARVDRDENDKPVTPVVLRRVVIADQPPAPSGPPAEPHSPPAAATPAAAPRP